MRRNIPALKSCADQNYVEAADELEETTRIETKTRQNCPSTHLDIYYFSFIYLTFLICFMEMLNNW